MQLIASILAAVTSSLNQGVGACGGVFLYRFLLNCIGALKSVIKNLHTALHMKKKLGHKN